MSSSPRLNKLFVVHRTQDQPPLRADKFSLAVSRWNPWVLAALFGVLLFIFSAGFDWFLIHRHESPFSMFSLSDLLSAFIGTLLFLKIAFDSRRRRRRLEARLQTIRDMNHHIRNALEVIALSAYTSKDQENMQAIRDSVQRINWALNEILPKM